MPQKYDVDDEPIAQQTVPCQGLREELKTCIMNSPCVKGGRLPKDCLTHPDHTVPDECLQLKWSFFECKRSLLDARQRFRGRKGY
ncbi:cytochrome c oxidase assembly factor 5-like [Amphibalanus amphitrite]|uniref:cytochrome c oxidase assembly factor 5-like n=1 Tax=Amphibalanus amphitrite TaxID=1232801 RepID=UPI001C9198D9|nr:cytochrome c oxidase assembly factor 5-like [Amphibalanus amphitrite]XP_043223910.1 cytochrome c oxidase assembly factor 5-like [Amphibalanus amphitrite]XP_043223911.1 cytochrome c oxidase assembly factor 5-like [Amphibalanus amphitrite]XP_043223912.1 cytochrome c oxidase assembly factor 5-like [Amphibalanus amphitrite]XP_043223913.1 cytochrome c oxidase assembly factor 5-like [Amphibalanus amphitrite]XP_043223914.1 cytochrome c oxidase assembly factor 5-like [Amphibalanus amphitrite]XP_04